MGIFDKAFRLIKGNPGGVQEGQKSPRDIAVPAEELVRVDIVGESHYQRELENLAGPKTEDGVSVWISADLVPEPDNPYDKSAVSVQIDGVTVGYLSRARAKAFHRMMTDHMTPGESLTGIDAEIRGGWRRPGGDEGTFGLTLYLSSIVAGFLDRT